MNIRSKLTLVMILISIVPVSAIGFRAYATIDSELRARTKDQLISTASRQESRISDILQPKTEGLLKLGSQLDYQTALSKFINNGSRTALAEIDDILNEYESDSIDVESVYLTDTEGKALAATNSSLVGTTLAENLYKPIGTSERSLKLQQDTNGIIRLFISTQQRVEGKEIGYLTSVYSIGDLTEKVRDNTGLGTTGETLIAQQNESGESISLFALRFDTAAAFNTNLDSLKIFSTQEEYYQANDYRNEPVLIAVTNVNLTDWKLATKQDISEAYGPIDQLRAAVISAVVILSVFTIVIAYYITRTFTVPIQELDKAAESIGKGELSTRTSVNRKDELGTLANNINTMGERLETFVADIEAQRKRLETVLNNTQESIIALDAAGNILLTNYATKDLTKVSPKELKGKLFDSIFTWKQKDKEFKVDYRLPGVQHYSNLTYTDSEGGDHSVDIVIAGVDVGKEKQAGETQTIVTIHDKTAEKELDDMKVDFVAMAAHELRTPLAAIRGYVDLVGRKMPKSAGPEVVEYLERAMHSARELAGLITSMLDVTKIERSSLELHYDKVDIAAELKIAVENVKFIAKDKKITVTGHGPEKDCWVNADQVALNEVINNLITNAIKYNNEGGTVDVFLKKDGNKYVLDVKDNGIGIPARSMGNLFTKFYRVDSGLTSGNQGTGLGLYISKSIIEMHGGTITVDSKEGVGSTFTIILPEFDASKVKNDESKNDNDTRRKRGWVTKSITR